MNNFQKFLVIVFSLIFVCTTMQYNKYLSQKKELNQLELQLEKLKKLKNNYDSIQL